MLAWIPAAEASVRRSADPGAVEIVQTSADLSQRLTALPALQFSAAPVARGLPVIDVNDRIRYQRVNGFGASMTDTSAWLLEQQLPATVAGPLMSELFGAGGIRLDFIRVPIGATDYTKNGSPYSYDDPAAGRSDPLLTRFSIAHDQAYILPALRQARAINPGVEILASPWSPPAWMKTNGSLDNVANHGTLRRSAEGPWARYFVKFLQAYARAGVPVAAVTPQNEPTNATSYPGLDLPVASEASWLVKDLEPALRAARLDPKIYGDDWGWGPRASAYAKALVANPAARTLSGVAWHCYFGSPYMMSTVRRIAPRLEPIVDECSPGITPFPTSEIVIGSLRNWASTVALWNLALDPHGGPVQPPNSGCAGCTGVVTIDPKEHSARLGINYYQLGQASAFVQPGAWRVDSEHFVYYKYTRPGVNLVTPGLDDVAFLNPDGSTVLLAYANSRAPISFAVQWQGTSFTYTLPAKATVTFVWDRPS